MKRKKFVKNLITPILLFLMALAGCSGVKSEMDKSASLGTFKTYSWKSPDLDKDNPEYNSGLIDENIKQSIEKELADQGISRDDQNPDVYVLYHSYTQKKEQVSGSLYSSPSSLSPGYSSPYGPFGYGGLGYSYGTGTYGLDYPIPYSNTQETIIIDFIDAKTNKVVWRGSSDRDVTDVTDLDKLHSKEVHAIMKKYSEKSDKMVKHSS